MKIKMSYEEIGGYYPEAILLHWCDDWDEGLLLQALILNCNEQLQYVVQEIKHLFNWPLWSNRALRPLDEQTYPNLINACLPLDVILSSNLSGLLQLMKSLDQLSSSKYTVEIKVPTIFFTADRKS